MAGVQLLIMKIAIVHDDLMRRGGAEQVARCFHLAFPEAPVYTMAYQPHLTYPDFKQCRVHTSWFGRIAKDEKRMKMFFFPLGLMAMQQLDVTGYDVVLVSTTYSAKYVKVSPHSLVITYCYTPFRLAWDPYSYEQYRLARGLKRKAFDLVIKVLRNVDYKRAQRTDQFIAMTAETRNRIRSAYHFPNDIPIIKPPVNCNNFYVAPKTKDYFLVVSRLEYYKRVDLVIDAFNDLGYPLVIVGRGILENSLKKRARANISFRSGISSQEMAQLYAECKAFIFPQHEDYGITPLEANASGRPVIGFNKGGILETMIPVTEGKNPGECTALLFNKQEKESLIEAVRKFESLSFDPAFIRRHAEQFHETAFIDSIRRFVLDAYQQSTPTPE
jgi:glycosyltransferase involved in cell wall biosynthesis